jgi:ATP-dependent helicase YprA (DUF1998 family)
MNALANSQAEELKKFIEKGFSGRSPMTFKRYTGQEKADEREAIRSNPPDVLLTNYMMLELLLTRREDRALVQAAQGLRFSGGRSTSALARCVWIPEPRRTGRGGCST